MNPQREWMKYKKKIQDAATETEKMIRKQTKRQKNAEKTSKKRRIY